MEQVNKTIFSDSLKVYNNSDPDHKSGAENNVVLIVASDVVVLFPSQSGPRLQTCARISGVVVKS